MAYTCKVCGYPQLETPPRPATLCPSCGTEYGFDDAATSHQTLLDRWVAGGMQWWDDPANPPNGWNPEQQIILAGLKPTILARKEVRVTIGKRTAERFKDWGLDAIGTKRPATKLKFTGSSQEAA